MKINNLKQLKTEKARNYKQCQELKSKAIADWEELRSHFVPRDSKQNNTKGGLFKTALAFGVKLATQTVADKATKRIIAIFKNDKSNK